MSTAFSEKFVAWGVDRGRILNPPLAARLKAAAVVPVMPTSRSRDTTSDETDAAAVNHRKSILMFSRAKDSISIAIYSGALVGSCTAPTVMTSGSAAPSGARRQDATDPAASMRRKVPL